MAKQKEIVRPILENLKKDHPPAAKPEPKPGPVRAAELDQDPGGGYNSDHTYPQT